MIYLDVLERQETTLKRIIALLCIVTLTLGLTACAGKAQPQAEGSNASSSQEEASSESSVEEAAESESSVAEEASSEEPQESSSEAEEPEETPAADKVLVVVFSATGTTKGVADKIAALTGADLYEIKAAQEYTDADLNWNDSSSRSTQEQNDPDARPEIGSDPISLEGYGTIYIGFPIWWGEEPRIMDTFVESYDFDGITMIPFCTSSSSGIGRSGQNLAEHAGSGNWLDGQRFSGGVSEEELQDWINSLQ